VRTYLYGYSPSLSISPDSYVTHSLTLSLSVCVSLCVSLFLSLSFSRCSPTTTPQSIFLAHMHTRQTRTPAPHQRNSITHPIASTCIAYMLARMYESKYEYKNVFRVCAQTVCARTRVCARADIFRYIFLGDTHPQGVCTI